MRVPVENLAQISWGALLIIYLAGAGRQEYRTWPVAAVFGLSAAAALLELYLRRRNWQGINLYDSAVWTVLLAAMVAATGGRSSEAWPAYLMMSLTAPSLGRSLQHYGLMGLNAAIYAGIYATVNPDGVPLVPALLLLRIGLFFLVTYVVDRLMSRAAQAARHRVSELVSARDAERRRMAFDIHDWLGTGLVAPMRRLELALRSPDPQAARDCVTESIESLRRSHEELRRIMEALHPHLLDQMGVAEALKAYCSDWSAEQQITVTFHSEGETEHPPAVALAAYRILQEALNNVARHAAGAANVQVTLSLHDAGATLTVADDGPGFAQLQRSGRGLLGMQERAEACGGALRIHARPGRGTRIVAELPAQKGAGPAPLP